MRIYPDTSFLVSSFYSGDVNHGRARAWFSRHQNDDWILSEWSRFETINSLRSLCLRPNGPPPEVAEALRRYLNRLLRQGRFNQKRIDWQEVLRDANQISAAFASRMQARAADTLHVAILEQVNPDVFVSGDQAQLALATARGFSAVPF